MVSEVEARACKHGSMMAPHPFRSGQALGPLMTWAVFFFFATLAGLLAH